MWLNNSNISEKWDERKPDILHYRVILKSQMKKKNIVQYFVDQIQYGQRAFKTSRLNQVEFSDIAAPTTQVLGEAGT